MKKNRTIYVKLIYVVKKHKFSNKTHFLQLLYTNISQMSVNKKQNMAVYEKTRSILSDNLMREVLSFLANVSMCLAVSTKFVPMDYITFVKVLANFDRDDIPRLLNKRKSITSLEFEEGPFVTSQFLSHLVYFHVQIERVVLRNVVLGVFPFINSKNVSFRLNGNRWINYCKDRKVEFIFEGNSSLLDRVHSSTPSDIIDRVFMFFGETTYDNQLTHYKEMIPFFDCSIIMMNQYRRVFSKPTNYSVGAEKINKDAAAVLICTDVNPYRHFITNFRRIDNTWKITHVINNCTHNFWDTYEV